MPIDKKIQMAIELKETSYTLFLEKQQLYYHFEHINKIRKPVMSIKQKKKQKNDEFENDREKKKQKTTTKM